MDSEVSPSRWEDYHTAIDADNATTREPVDEYCERSECDARFSLEESPGIDRL